MVFFIFLKECARILIIVSGRIIIHVQGVNKKTGYIKAGARMHGFRV